MSWVRKIGGEAVDFKSKLLDSPSSPLTRIRTSAGQARIDGEPS
jgi:hypothetical protein